MNTPKSTSLDLPPVLSRLMGMPSQLPSYQQGGMIGPGGEPDMRGQTPAGLSKSMQAGQPMTNDMLVMQVNQFARQNTDQLEEIKQVFMELMQSGELTQQELNMLVQLATVAAQNPDMYPNVRRFAIQQGIAAPEDIPEQYDQGLIFMILLAARAMQQGIGGQDVMQGGVPAMEQGGTVPTSKRNDGAVPILAHEGEYVIPKHVVAMKGKEFFDSLIEKYRDK